MDMHADWDLRWEATNARDWAIEALDVNSPNTKRGHSESAIKRYTFLIEAYWRRVRDYGLTGAFQAVASEYEALGINPTMVASATFPWREHWKVPVRSASGSGGPRKPSASKEDLAALRDFVVSLAESLDVPVPPHIMDIGK